MSDTALKDRSSTHILRGAIPEEETFAFYFGVSKKAWLNPPLLP